MSCTLFLKNNRQSKQRNLQLLKFLSNNVKQLVESGFVFEIVKVSKRNYSDLKRNGIPATPALLVESGPVVGTTAIIKFLIDSCETPPGPVKKTKARDEEPEDVKDLLLEIIQNYNEDEEEEDPKDTVKKMNEDMMRRSSSEPNTSASISTNEDEAMSKYWDNLEETEI